MKQKIKIRPLADRVIVLPAEKQEKSPGGIIIPDTAKEKPQEGIVVAVGPGKEEEPMSVKVNDKVLYSEFGGREVTIEGVKYLVLRVSDIYGIIDN